MVTNENTGKEVSKNLGDVVANEHLGKYVKVCLTNIQVTESQRFMRQDLVSMVFLISP